MHITDIFEVGKCWVLLCQHKYHNYNENLRILNIFFNFVNLPKREKAPFVIISGNHLSCTITVIDPWKSCCVIFQAVLSVKKAQTPETHAVKLCSLPQDISFLERTNHYLIPADSTPTSKRVRHIQEYRFCVFTANHRIIYNGCNLGVSILIRLII